MDCLLLASNTHAYRLQRGQWDVKSLHSSSLLISTAHEDAKKVFAVYLFHVNLVAYRVWHKPEPNVGRILHTNLSGWRHWYDKKDSWWLFFKKLTSHSRSPYRFGKPKTIPRPVCLYKYIQEIFGVGSHHGPTIYFIRSWSYDSTFIPTTWRGRQTFARYHFSQNNLCYSVAPDNNTQKLPAFFSIPKNPGVEQKNSFISSCQSFRPKQILRISP